MNANLTATAYLARLLIRASLRDIQSLVVNLGTPLLIVAMFALNGQAAAGGTYLLPFLLTIPVMFGGAMLGVRVTTWQGQNVFRRLAVTPVPLSYLLGGMLAAQWAVNVLQAVVVLLAVVALGVALTPVQFLLSMVVVALGSFTFTALGALVATLVRRPDLLSYAYVLVMMPMAFISMGMVSVPVLSVVLPTSLFTTLINGVRAPLDPPTLFGNAGALALYGCAFLYLAGRRFRWE